MQQQTYDDLNGDQISALGGPGNIVIDQSIPRGQIEFRGGVFDGSRMKLPRQRQGGYAQRQIAALAKRKSAQP